MVQKCNVLVWGHRDSGIKFSKFIFKTSIFLFYYVRLIYTYSLAEDQILRSREKENEWMNLLNLLNVFVFETLQQWRWIKELDYRGHRILSTQTQRWANSSKASEALVARRTLQHSRTYRLDKTEVKILIRDHCKAFKHFWRIQFPNCRLLWCV